jgi:hypothetical protein
MPSGILMKPINFTDFLYCKPIWALNMSSIFMIYGEKGYHSNGGVMLEDTLLKVSR